MESDGLSDSIFIDLFTIKKMNGDCEIINILLKFYTVYADIYIDIVCQSVYNIVILYKFLL